MAEKPVVYVETSVISYYVSKPSSNLIAAGHQQITWDWWEKAEGKFVRVISSVVYAEITAGDPVAAAKRLEAIEGWPMLLPTADMGELMARYIRDADDAMDDIHRHLFTLLTDRKWEHGVTAAVDVTLLGRYYERFADHAVQISRRIIFQSTGQGQNDDWIPTPKNRSRPSGLISAPTPTPTAPTTFSDQWM